VPGLGAAAPHWPSYPYDPTGNRLPDARHAAAGDTTRTGGHPAADQPQPHTLRTLTESGPGGGHTDTYGYDAAGNLASHGAQTLHWDDEGMLASVAEGAAVSSYRYDADGNRLVRHDPDAATLDLGATQVRLDRASGAVAALRSYTLNGTTVAVRTSNVQHTWLVGDDHGTALLAIAHSDLSVLRRRFTPFGEPRGTQ